MSLPFVFMMILWPLACCAKGQEKVPALHDEGHGQV